MLTEKFKCLFSCCFKKKPVEPIDTDVFYYNH